MWQHLFLFITVVDLSFTRGGQWTQTSSCKCCSMCNTNRIELVKLAGLIQAADMLVNVVRHPHQVNHDTLQTILSHLGDLAVSFLTSHLPPFSFNNLRFIPGELQNHQGCLFSTWPDMSWKLVCLLKKDVAQKGNEGPVTNVQVVLGGGGCCLWSSLWISGNDGVPADCFTHTQVYSIQDEAFFITCIIGSELWYWSF